MGKRGPQSKLKAPKNSPILKLLVESYKYSGLSAAQFVEESGLTRYKLGRHADELPVKPAQAIWDTVRRKYKIHVALADYVLKQTLLAQNAAQRLRTAMLAYGLEPDKVPQAMRYIDKLKGVPAVRDVPNRLRVLDRKG